LEPDRLSASGSFGVIVGCSAWALLLMLFFLGKGAFAAALAIGLPLLVLSLGFSALILLALQGLARILGMRSRGWILALFGLLCFFLGLVFLMVNPWIGPAMRAAGIIDAESGPILGVSTVHEWLPTLFLILGAGLLFRVAHLCRNAAGSRREGP